MRTEYSYLEKGILIGGLLGLGAPIGSLIFRILWFGQADPVWIADEVHTHFYHYMYMTLLTPLVFGLFGGYLGHLNDYLFCQKKSADKLMRVLECQSVTDDVTGLFNHRQILREVDKEVERARRHDRPMAAMMVDIDNFKRINDTYGHLAGDVILKEAALLLKSRIRKIDIIGRYGGDEFILIFPETDLEKARLVANRVSDGIGSHHFKVGDKDVRLTLSGGLLFFDDTKALSTRKFLDRVDQAMLEAKGAGKNRIIFK